MGKSGPNTTFNLIFLGLALGWPWVGEFDGFMIILISFPTQHNLVNRKHPNAKHRLTVSDWLRIRSTLWLRVTDVYDASITNPDQPDTSNHWIALVPVSYTVGLFDTILAGLFDTIPWLKQTVFETKGLMPANGLLELTIYWTLWLNNTVQETKGLLPANG